VLERFEWLLGIDTYGHDHRERRNGEAVVVSAPQERNLHHRALD
jgi:hypothetical protein